VNTSKFASFSCTPCRGVTVSTLTNRQKAPPQNIRATKPTPIAVWCPTRLVLFHPMGNVVGCGVDIIVALTYFLAPICGHSRINWALKLCQLALLETSRPSSPRKGLAGFHERTCDGITAPRLVMTSPEHPTFHPANFIPLGTSRPVHALRVCVGSLP
jgi:hypothetical protein